MHFTQFLDHTGQYLQSAPIKVKMQGFESTTTSLQNNGWQISVETFKHMAIDATDMRVAFKHDGIKQMAIGIMRFDGEFLSNARFTHFQAYLGMGIEISYMAPMIKCVMIPMNDIHGFQAIDARPRLHRVEKDLSEFAMFKPIKGEDFELYINQKDEAEIMDFILKKQDPRQKEIRQNQKRRSYLEGNQGFLSPTIEDKINTDIKSQLIICA